MNKIITTVLLAFSCIFFTTCNSSTSSNNDKQEALHFGANIEVTGDYSYAGEASRNAFNLFVKKVNKAGGIMIGDKGYPIHFDLKDNGGTTEGSKKVAKELINEDDALLVIGPNVSKLAIAASGVANNLNTLMISPWSSNPSTTKNHPWVYRASYVDTDQSPLLAKFAASHLNATKACILYDNEPNAFPSGFAATFKADWEEKHDDGSVVAYESFKPGDEDLSSQLTTIANAGCDFLLIPEYAYVIPSIMHQAHEAGITVPIIGPDSWVGDNLVEECGADCEGDYFTKHFVASSATSGNAKAFVDGYKTEYGTAPGDVAGLTWDAMLLAKQALKNCGKITGDLAVDRKCVRDGMRDISNFKGVTGTYTFTNSNNPEKCIPIVQIKDGGLTFVKKVCP
jgi:branched-chain amino acid transport system substrate-binding protein